MMGRLTDNEIVKVLECCVKQRCESCLQYGMYADDENCMRFAMENAFDLINRLQAKNKELDEKLIIQKGLIDTQKAEIERLKEENKFHRKTITENAQRALEVTIEEVDKAKSEAYREFWTKLRTHGRKMMGNDYSGEFCAIAILVEDGDNLLNELTRNLHDTCTEINE